MSDRELRIDPAMPLGAEPSTGHNRWHPAIAPNLECEPGDRVVLHTRDAFDGQIGPDATTDAVASANLNLVHPLTGPVFVHGAQPGDAIEVKIQAVEADSYGFTIQVPGFGFLRDVFPDPFLVKWSINDNVAVSSDLPGVRVQGAPFMGTIGVSPDARLLKEIIRRETASQEAGGFALPPEATDAVPSDPGVAAEAVRTIPPRETAGNIDVRQLTAGTSLFLPSFVEGALFSAGDAHFAQGDGEVCGTAIEMRAALHVEFAVHKGAAARLSGGWYFEGDHSQHSHSPTPPGRYVAIPGMSVTTGGETRAEDLTLAARNAVLGMIDYLARKGWTEQEAYAITSVAVDLKVSELVDVPSYVVTAFLPLGIFADGRAERP